MQGEEEKMKSYFDRWETARQGLKGNPCPSKSRQSPSQRPGNGLEMLMIMTLSSLLMVFELPCLLLRKVNKLAK